MEVAMTQIDLREFMFVFLSLFSNGSSDDSDLIGSVINMECEIAPSVRPARRSGSSAMRHLAFSSMQDISRENQAASEGIFAHFREDGLSEVFLPCSPSS
jgi:hypothetical protein